MKIVDLRVARDATVQLVAAAIPVFSWIALIVGYLVGTIHVIHWTWNQFVPYIGRDAAATGFILTTIANVALLVIWLFMYAELRSRAEYKD